jgi:hypothetical protein
MIEPAVVAWNAGERAALEAAGIAWISNVFAVENQTVVRI